MTDALSSRLAARGVAILDGGLATQLQARGHALDDALWSARLLIDAPSVIADVHRAYADAGADIVTTATYQASAAGFARLGLDPAEIDAALDGAAGLARAATRHTGALVAASIGSYGAHRADGSEYRGDYGLTDAALADFHRDRLRRLATGADLVACETIPSLAEGHVLARLLADDDGPPAWISWSVRDDAHCSHGEPIEACVAAVADVPRVAAVGVNCFDPAWAETLVARIAAVTGRPIVVYPNSGERWDAHAHAWTGDAADVDAHVALAARWHAAGARIIGGCCRTGPAQIAALVRWRDGLR
jgi:homocysteine S-methyltransferase